MVETFANILWIRKQAKKVGGDWWTSGDNLVPEGREEEGAWELGCGGVVMNAKNWKTGRA